MGRLNPIPKRKASSGFARKLLLDALLGESRSVNMLFPQLLAKTETMVLVLFSVLPFLPVSRRRTLLVWGQNMGLGCFVCSDSTSKGKRGGVGGGC